MELFVFAFVVVTVVVIVAAARIPHGRHPSEPRDEDVNRMRLADDRARDRDRRAG